MYKYVVNWVQVEFFDGKLEWRGAHNLRLEQTERQIYKWRIKNTNLLFCVYDEYYDYVLVLAAFSVRFCDDVDAGSFDDDAEYDAVEFAALAGSVDGSGVDGGGAFPLPAYHLMGCPV